MTQKGCGESDEVVIDENMSLDVMAHGKPTPRTQPLKTRADYSSTKSYTDTVIALATIAVAEARRQPRTT